VIERRVEALPIEVSDVDEFIRLSEKAEHCLVKRKKDKAKLKLRTKKELFTLKTGSKEIDEILKKLKCETREI